MNDRAPPARSAVYVPREQRPPPCSLGVDGPVDGAATIYSHWRTAPLPPPELDADTSTEMLLIAARDPRRWLEPYAVACNNHIDADGLMSLAAACAPDLALRHASLLIGAAEAGDFRSWPGEAPFRLMLRLHQLVRDEHARGGAWEQRCCDAATRELEALIADSARADGERDEETTAVTETIVRLAHRDGYAITGDERLTNVRWRARLGHPYDTFKRVRLPDDAPPWALSAILPERAFQLLAMEVDGGIAYELDAPRWSWARTVRRRPVAWPWPDLQGVAERLQQRERGRCRWSPKSAELAFTSILASVHNGTLAPSSLPLEVVEAECRAAVAT
jgi:hypothetical protein